MYLSYGCTTWFTYSTGWVPCFPPQRVVFPHYLRCNSFANYVSSLQVCYRPGFCGQQNTIYTLSLAAVPLQSNKRKHCSCARFKLPLIPCCKCRGIVKTKHKVQYKKNKIIMIATQVLLPLCRNYTDCWLHGEKMSRNRDNNQCCSVYFRLYFWKIAVPLLSIHNLPV